MPPVNPLNALCLLVSLVACIKLLLVSSVGFTSNNLQLKTFVREVGIIDHLTPNILSDFLDRLVESNPSVLDAVLLIEILRIQ